MTETVPEAALKSVPRRFISTQRLYGDSALEQLQKSHVCVVGIGGVGSWAVEALARSGVGKITLIDMDHIAESNINRQVHALESTLGKAKIVAMTERIQEINPDCQVVQIDDYVTAENASSLIPTDANAVLDCIDQVKPKIAMILLAKQRKQRLLVCGGAGGKVDPTYLKITDLAYSTQDPLLAKIRSVLRQEHNYPKGDVRTEKSQKMGVQVVASSQAMSQGVCEVMNNNGAALNCAGYGSSVMVTASMGLLAVSWCLQ